MPTRQRRASIESTRWPVALDAGDAPRPLPAFVELRDPEVEPRPHRRADLPVAAGTQEATRVAHLAYGGSPLRPRRRVDQHSPHVRGGRLDDPGDPHRGDGTGRPPRSGPDPRR